MNWRAIIFTEGKTEVRFLHSYLQHLGIPAEMHPTYKSAPKDDTVYIFPMNTNTPGDEMLTIMQQRMEKTSTALFLLDADNDFTKSKQNAENLCNNKIGQWQGKTIAYFLTPSNDATGNMETLLREISVKEEVYNCIEQYKQCIKQLGTEYKPIDQKAEIYAYIEANNQNANVDKRNYQNNPIWNLESPALTNLKTFLTQHLN